ncbi:MAG: hypothetical protein MUF31_06760 [Akkermansiaceae bacterium]|jgi:hypothetical protein|nr:hypothetical protein [Akkermansiaceae bacterium]
MAQKEAVALAAERIEAREKAGIQWEVLGRMKSGEDLEEVAVDESHHVLLDLLEHPGS